MSNDSTTAGFLTPDPTQAPLEDAALENFLQEMIVGLTALDPTLVRPRWQPQMPNIPENTVDWVAIGIKTAPSDTFAFDAHQPAGEGQDFIQRHEELDVLCSFYGPNAGGYASMVRDGLSVEQNRTYLTEAGMGLIGCGEPIAVPEQINNLWYKRIDFSIGIRRSIERVYKIRNLLSAVGDIVTDISPLTRHINVTNS